MPATQGSHILVRKLRVFDVLTDEEANIVTEAAQGTASFAGGQDLIRAGDRPGYSSVLIEGWAARGRTLEDGARQIMCVHVVGDFIDLHSFLLKTMDHSVTALTDRIIAKFPHDRLRRISEREPHLTRVLWLNTLVDAAIHRNWIVSMGRLSAASRLAQLLCEMYTRLAAVEAARDNSFVFPLTQPLVADALGLSLVHVGRTMRELKERELVNWRSRTVEILDWDRLAAFAQFDPTYLNQRQEPR